ncbi:MAG: hypothetical protein O2985_08545, partial [Proteobacteria bacterium]|nr:hypothetical protein [Pseudomonadota bacterium]
MAEISNRKDFEAWLVGKPREVVVAMANRAALSTLPYLANDVRADRDRRAAAIILPFLRAMAPPWFAGTWPNQGGEVRAAASAAASASAAAAASAAAS